MSEKEALLSTEDHVDGLSGVSTKNEHILPPESGGSLKTRRYIIVLFAATLALLGVPMWYATTSIYRASLPYDQMEYYDNAQNLYGELQVKVTVGMENKKLVSAVQSEVNSRLSTGNFAIDIVPGCLKGHACIKDAGTGAGREVLISTQDPTQIANYLVNDIYGEERMRFQQDYQVDRKVVAYSPDYHITFSLFVEDGNPVEWGIENAMNEYLVPVLSELEKKVANFTVDSQIQYYSELDQKDRTKGVDISTFVNFAEWSVNSIHSYPSINFIIYIPKANDPIKIQDSKSNSFLIPQWGGIKILNLDNSQSRTLTKEDLLPVLELFTSQLFTLLGAPSQPPKYPLLQIDSLSRLTTLRALKDATNSLGSLSRLANALPTIAIPRSVSHLVESSLNHIHLALKALKSSDDSGIWYAGLAMKDGHDAFFEKQMVQQAFFPDEHKVAVYLPLLGPVCVMVFLGVVRLKKEWKQ